MALFLFFTFYSNCYSWSVRFVSMCNIVYIFAFSEFLMAFNVSFIYGFTCMFLVILLSNFKILVVVVHYVYCVLRTYDVYNKFINE